MRNHRKHVVSVFILLLVLSCAAIGWTAPQTNNYPSKPIDVIIAFAPGGGTDIAGRLVFKYAEKYAGTSFHVINKAGAGGQTGFTALAHAEKDGYTIGMVNVPTIVMLPIQRGDKITYQVSDIDFVANFVSDPGTFIVAKGSSIHSMTELLDIVKKDPEAVTLAYPGPGSTEALTMRRMEQATGINFKKVIIKDPEECYKALAAGTADVVMLNTTEVYEQYKSKSIRVLGQTGPQRIKMMPDVPTFVESGIPITQVAMRGLAVPQGLTIEQKEYLANVINKTLADPDFQREAEKLNLPLQFLDYKQFSKKIANLNDELTQEFTVGGAW